MQEADRERWRQLSPLLDELLDLDDEPARAARLAALRATDPALAGELAAMLERHRALDAQGYLEAAALPPPTGLAGLAGLAGQKLGAYTLEREIGRGGMGQVWLAERTDGRYAGRVAIKLLQGGLFGHGDAARFTREGSILARLGHHHIARLLDAGVAADGHQPYLVLEYVDGVPIDRYAEQHTLPLAARLALMLDVLDAVAHAHARLILHRDLKPSNVLVDRQGTVKLLDFGIAKLLDDSAAADGAGEALTQRAGVAFTPLYAAPEQLQQGEVTTASDVYSLGVMLYGLLGGGHPTAAVTTSTTPLERLRSTVETEPRRLSEAVRRAGGPQAERRARELQGDLDTIVAKALKKSAAERYANAGDLADELRRFLRHEPIAARPDTLAYRAAKLVRRNRIGVAAGGVAALALLVGAALALVQARKAEAQRDQAEGLIEFMLGDLRHKLQPVGRLDTLDAVGEKALAYYAAQEVARLDAASLGRRARALHLIGEIAEKRGQFDEAARRFQQAADSTAELMQRHPNDGQRIFDHAQSEFWVGLVARRRGEREAAAAAWGRYRALAGRLVQIDATRADWRVEIGFAEQNLGGLHYDAGHYPQALAAFEQARAVFEREAPARPVELELARNLGWIASTREALTKYDAAVQAHRDRIAVLQARREAATDREAQGTVALAEHDIGRLLLMRNRLPEAEAAARRAVAGAQALAALDPGHRERQAQWGVTLVGLADVLAAADRRGEAHAVLAEARRALQPLWAPQGNAYWQIQTRARWLATTAEIQGPRPDPVLTAEMRALTALVLDHQASGKPLSRVQQRAAGAVALAQGDALAAAGEAGAAAEAWQLAVRWLDGQQQDMAALTLLAHARLRLGEVQVAAGLADSVQASPYRHPRVADLWRRLGREPLEKD